MTCSECERIKNRKYLVYEDSLVAAVLNERPSTGGHIILLPKEHQPIIERLSDDLMSHMFSVANKLSIACFDALGAHGTNILIQNGVTAGQKTAHASVHIIPRVENDGLNFNWKTIKESEPYLKMTQEALESGIVSNEEVKEEKKEEIKEVLPEEDISEEENYLTRQLERIP